MNEIKIVIAKKEINKIVVIGSFSNLDRNCIASIYAYCVIQNEQREKTHTT